MKKSQPSNPPVQKKETDPVQAALLLLDKLKPGALADHLGCSPDMIYKIRSGARTGDTMLRVRLCWHLVALCVEIAENCKTYAEQ